MTSSFDEGTDSLYICWDKPSYCSGVIVETDTYTDKRMDERRLMDIKDTYVLRELIYVFDSDMWSVGLFALNLYKSRVVVVCSCC